MSTIRRVQLAIPVVLPDALLGEPEQEPSRTSSSPRQWLPCPHCGEGHADRRGVELCRLHRLGWIYVDADGYLCNGHRTRPDYDGPKSPLRLVKRACRSCARCSLSRSGALLCTAEDSPVPIVIALDVCTSARRRWRSRAPAPPINLKQAVLFDEDAEPDQGTLFDEESVSP